MHENRESSWTVLANKARPVREGHKPNGGRERSGEVGPRRSGAIPLEESLKIAAQIADAFEAANEKGVVHRDLKPGNIKVKPDGTVKVLDLGHVLAHEITHMLQYTALHSDSGVMKAHWDGPELSQMKKR